MDLFGLSRTISLGGNFTWTLFLAAKNDTFLSFERLAKVLGNEMFSKKISLRSDHGERVSK